MLTTRLHSAPFDDENPIEAMGRTFDFAITAERPPPEVSQSIPDALGEDRCHPENVSRSNSPPPTRGSNSCSLCCAWSDTVYVGVMAQEVALLHPDAIVRDASDAYLRVDYGRLGSD
jgi:hypothetical protein